jgi:phosphoenolpyruvate---glycerone phosphotransferase subunit DhaK
MRERHAIKKLINSPDTVLAESLDGFAAAHGDLVCLGEGRKFVRRRVRAEGKVALVSGGGSGHEPLHAGYVGYGMLDAACPGQVFTAPTPDQMLAAIHAVDGGAGVLLIVKNYAGDVMNFEMAAETIGGPIARVLTDDDVAVGSSALSAGRRGVAGTMIVEKIVGAAAEQGWNLAGCEALGRRVNAGTRTLGVALTSATVPAAGGPTFTLGPDEMEIGVGIHGEQGRRRTRLQPAKAIAEEMVTAIVGDLGAAAAGPCLMLVNGFGGTPAMELYVMYDNARRIAERHGVTIARSLVGNYVTSLDMAGCSITLSRLDDELASLWDSPVHTPALRWGL